MSHPPRPQVDHWAQFADAEAIRGLSIFEIFADLRGEPKANFDEFMSLAQASVVFEVIDLTYLVPDASGQTVHGWSNACTWPDLRRR